MDRKAIRSMGNVLLFGVAIVVAAIFLAAGMWFVAIISLVVVPLILALLWDF